MEFILRELIIFLIAFTFLVTMDVIWFALLMKKFYLSELARHARFLNGGFSINIPAALCVWALLTFGALFFVVPIATLDTITVITRGAFFGVIVYGVYDLTNYAVLYDWSLRLTLTDLVWGIFTQSSLAFVVALLRKSL